jgi:hypothetical protein
MATATATSANMGQDLKPQGEACAKVKVTTSLVSLKL